MNDSKISIDDVLVTGNRRAINEPAVRDLADSIKKIGLLNAITLRTDKRLIAGRHRLAAYTLLRDEAKTDEEKERWSAIPASFMESGPAADIAEIDENLIRLELTQLERAELLGRRKEMYLKMHPETKRGGDRRSRGRNQNPDSGVRSFAADTAAKTGQSKSTISESVQIAENLTPEVKASLNGTPMADHKTELLALSRVAQEDQAQVVEAIQTGAARTVAQAVEVRLPVQKWLKETYGGKGWFTEEEALASLGQRQRGLTQEKIYDSVRRIKDVLVEKKRVAGKDRWRIHNSKRKPTMPTSVVEQCFSELETLVDGIREVTDKHITVVRQKFILEQVVRIERLLKKFRDETINEPSRPTK